MTREEFYKLTDILNSEVLGNFMHGGEADELIAMFEEAVEHSNILEQEEPVSIVWHDVGRETPTGFCEAIIVLCRNKNMEDGIWLADLIQDWEGEWEPRTNWETPVKWAYVKDLINLTLSEATNMGEQEPVSEELEEAARRYAAFQAGMKDAMTSEFYEEYPYSPNDVNAFKAGAKWQKEKDAILPKVWNRKNLDDFSYQTAYDLSNDWAKETPTWDDVEKACKLGANWQRKQDQKSMEIMDEVYFKSCDMIRKQMIDKACKYLQDHREEVETEDNGISRWISYEFIEKFGKYLEE